MHIAVNLGVQKIASFQVDNLLPEEIDHELNDAMDSFIKQRYSPAGNKYRKGFEQSQKRIDDLRALVVDGRTKCFYAGESISGFYIDRAPLPNDYMFLVNAISDNYHDCNGPVSYKTPNFSYKVVQISLSAPEGYTGYKLTKIQLGGNPLVTNEAGLDLQYLTNWNNYEGNAVTNIYPAASDINMPAVDSTDSASYTLSTLAESELTPTSDSNTLTLLVSQTLWESAPQTFTAVWIDPSPNPGPEQSVDYAVNSNAGEAIAVRYRTFDELGSIPGTRQREKMSFVQHDDLYSLLSDPFNTTTYNKIKYTIQENFIDVHSDQTFFTTFVDIKYIRQPKRMDKSAGVGCELAPHTHNEIVEMAINSILEAISDPRYNTQTREVLGSE